VELAFLERRVARGQLAPGADSVETRRLELRRRFLLLEQELCRRGVLGAGES
jgi:hypothetical protein